MNEEEFKIKIEQPEQENNPEDKAILTQLVGIKNLKSANSWRLEFDVAASDQSKIKSLVGELYNTFYMVLVKVEDK